MRMHVNRDRCEGYGFCEQAAPVILRLDDEGEPEVLLDAIPSEELHAAEAATRVCPVAALSIQAP